MPQSSGTGNATFAQQGTVDWTALSRSSFTFSVEVMSRFSKAGVEMITCAMGQAMSSQFNVPPEGQKRVTDAISKLKAYSSYGQVLWFGFGVKHIVRSLCETKQGATCAALCACLRVSYSTEMSARVLSVLCDQMLPSDGLSPALPQWAALIDVCSGTLSPSKFPAMVDGFCRLAFAPRLPLKYHKATTADALARALAELSKVSNGSVSSITFEGGYDCGWVAAVAEWLLCLKVKVLTAEGSCLYSQNGSHTNDSAQVVIIFDRDTDDSNPSKTTELRIVNRSFRLPCNGEVIYFGPFPDRVEVFGMGRSSWSTILEDTFGSTFKQLLSPNVIEIFARLLLSSVKARPPDERTSSFTIAGGEIIHPWMHAPSSPAATRERAFFLTIVDRLPELTPLLDVSEQLERSVGAAAGPDGDRLWATCCHCESLYSCHSVFDHMCLSHVALTLIYLIWLLASIDVDETLQPASTGLLMLYDFVQNDANVTCFIISTTRESLSWAPNLDDIYRRTFELFTGLPIHKSLHKSGTASAMCHGGVCIWLPALEDPLYEPTTQMRLRVVPGMINFRNRLYREMMDMEDDMEEDHSIRAVDTIMRNITTHGTTRGSTLVVRETLDASRLEASIELRYRRTPTAFNTYYKVHITKLYGTMYFQIDNIACEANLGCARSQNLPKADLTTWERPCPRLAVLLESNTPPRRSYNYPEAGEWVAVITDPNLGAPIVRIFRGDFALLYHLVSLNYTRLATCLSYFDGCVRCLASGIAIRHAKHDDTSLPDYLCCDGCKFAIIKEKHDGECLIEIHTITESECIRWSAKMTGFYLYADVKHKASDFTCRLNKIYGPLHDNTLKSDSAEPRET